MPEAGPRSSQSLIPFGFPFGATRKTMVSKVRGRGVLRGQGGFCQFLRGRGRPPLARFSRLDVTARDRVTDVGLEGRFETVPRPGLPENRPVRTGAIVTRPPVFAPSPLREKVQRTRSRGVDLMVNRLAGFGVSTRRFKEASPRRGLRGPARRGREKRDKRGPTATAARRKRGSSKHRFGFNDGVLIGGKKKGRARGAEGRSHGHPGKKRFG